MEDKLEKLIKLVYRNWKKSHPVFQGAHPDEEDIACFIEGKLPEKENRKMMEHLVICGRCSEIIGLEAKMKASIAENPPEKLLSRVRNLVIADVKAPVFEIFLKLKQNLLEIVNTNGDILFGNELVPAPLLRSRQIKDFKEVVTILKDFNKVRIEAKIENKEAGVFNVIIIAKEKQTNKIIPGLRVTLIKDNLELESYLNDSGSVTFERIVPGRYSVEVATTENKLAIIILDIKK